jgi:hypothetical protein
MAKISQGGSIPVENPVFDRIVGIGSLVASSGQRIDNLSLPVVLDQVLEIFAISWSRVRDVVIREPTLKLSLVPFVVCCRRSIGALVFRAAIDLPALLNHVLAVAVEAKPATRNWINLMMRRACFLLSCLEM